MTFEPWKTFSHPAYLANNIPVVEPPCKSCWHWRPKVTTDDRGNYAGVVLCTNIGKQQNDFSCYVSIGTETA